MCSATRGPVRSDDSRAHRDVGGRGLHGPGGRDRGPASDGLGWPEWSWLALPVCCSPRCRWTEATSRTSSSGCWSSGTGLAFVASQIAALAGVAEGESAAAGLVDSLFNIGGALGIAILSTVAVSRADDALSGVGREAELRATTEGFQAAFAVAAGLAAIGALLAVLLFRPARAGARPHGAPRAVRQAVQRQEHR